MAWFPGYAENQKEKLRIGVKFRSSICDRQIPSLLWKKSLSLVVITSSFRWKNGNGSDVLIHRDSTIMLKLARVGRVLPRR